MFKIKKNNKDLINFCISYQKDFFGNQFFKIYISNIPVYYSYDMSSNGK